MLSIEKLQTKKAELLSKMEAITESAEDVLSDEQQNSFDALKAEFDATVKSIEKAEALEKARQDAENLSKRPAPARERIVPLEQVEAPTPSTSAIKLPAEARRSYSLKAFKGNDANERAYGFGMFVRACVGDYEAARWCNDHGINTSRFATSHNSTTDAQGGYLVPTQYSNDIHSLMYTYGIARQECNVIQLTSDTFNRPKRLTGLTAYAVGESAAVTESNKTWGNIQLLVKDWAIITRMTRQLSADALISVADDLMNEIAQQFAAKEDDCLFNGNGESAYHYIDGLSARMYDTYGSDSGTGQLVAGDTLYLSTLRTLISKVASFARKGSKWYVSPTIFDSVFCVLAERAGGNTTTHIVNGVPTNVFMGYPVVLTESLPSDFTDSGNASDAAIIAYFGNLKMAADFGDRQQIAVDFSDSATVGGESVFERNQIAVRGFERFALNVHSYGQDDEPTPIAGLLVYGDTTVDGDVS